MSNLSEEEIMKILKDTISLFNNDTYCFTHSNDERTEAIQGLLDLYNKEKEKNKELEKELITESDIGYQCAKTDYDTFYIHKEKIREKIEKLKKEGDYRDIYNPTGRVHFMKEETDYKIEILQELLEEE